MCGVVVVLRCLLHPLPVTLLNFLTDSILPVIYPSLWMLGQVELHKALNPPHSLRNPTVTHNEGSLRPECHQRSVAWCVFFPPPGECVLQRAVMVRKKLSAREGRGWLSGTLFCTHFRVAFVPQDSPKPDVRPSAQLLDASQLNPSSHVMFSPCHAGQCRPVAPGGSRRGLGLYWEGGGRWVKLLEDLLFNCCTTSQLSMTYDHKVI